MESLFTIVPQGFTETYRYYANLGFRVLCLADRNLNEESDDRELIE